MHLLLLSPAQLDDVLPALGLLSHEVRVAPFDSPLRTVQSLEAAGEGFDAVLLDGTKQPATARSSALALAGTSAPRVAILAEASLAALSLAWDVSEILLPDASPAEVDTRLRLLAARSAQVQSPAPDDDRGAVEFSGVTIDESNFVAKAHGRTLDLTYKEFELLHFLVLNPARVFTREHLLAEVWGTDYFGGTRTVDVHVRRLRAKLGEHEWLISTVRGVGYGFARGRQEDDPGDTKKGIE